MSKLKKYFISATTEYNTADKYIPLPLFRRKFDIKKEITDAAFSIGSLGYYEVHFNGKNITKGYMAPYRSNPEHYVYYDKYDVKSELKKGSNVIGIILGNGFQNSIVPTWDFDKLPWRSAPAVSFKLEIKYSDGTDEIICSDEQTKTAPSPITFNDFHIGEHYDARLYSPDWDKPNFDDSDWKGIIKTGEPKGEIKLCEAEPIVATREIKAVSITECDGGYIYDFGENNAGVCRLEIMGEEGQKISFFHFETLKDGKPYLDNINFDGIIMRDFQHNEYICSGKGLEIHTPRFTYHGFRYVYVKGIKPCQATEDLLTYITLSSDLKKIGAFVSDNEFINKLQEATQRSDISNFHYFPTDCPHREKQGWTADASLSAEQMLLNFAPENSYREWLKNIYKAMKPDGELPGIVPTGTWGYEWGNGPAWDNVIVYLPYYTYIYRGNMQILEDVCEPLYKYLKYIDSKLDKNGLIAIGLGDWCQPGKKGGGYDTPLEVTDSIVCVDIARKAEFIYDKLCNKKYKKYAQDLAERITDAIRKNLIKDGLVSGNTQTAQAMALYYGLIEEKDREKAFSYLLQFIEEKQGHLWTGVLGARVIFRLLTDNGYGNIAFNMITRTDFPSFANWIVRGTTTLWERFWDEGEEPYSMNHHFWGDISAWFYTYLAGIKINPAGSDINNVNISPFFAQKLNNVKAKTACQGGEIAVEWNRTKSGIELEISAPDNIHGEIILPVGYTFADIKSNKRSLSTDRFLINE